FVVRRSAAPTRSPIITTRPILLRSAPSRPPPSRRLQIAVISDRLYFNAFAAARAAAANRTAIWSITETFTAVPGLSDDRYPPGDALRIDQQVNAIRPYVTGFVSWIFGNDMSPQATYYPVEASDLNRRYRARFRPAVFPDWSVLPIASYQCSPQPSPYYPDSTSMPKLSNRTGGGYNGGSLAEWIGFRVEDTGGIVEVTADLGAVREIKAAKALTQSWTESGIYRPSSMGVEVSTDGVNWSVLGVTTEIPSNTPKFSVMWAEVLHAATARYVKWRFAHIGWLFLSELEVLGSAGPATPPNISVTISPPSVTLGAMGVQQFIATVHGTPNTGVTWSHSPQVGTLDAGGLYTAPSNVNANQIVAIQANSIADPSKYAWATVNLTTAAAAPPQVGPMNPSQGGGLERLFSFESQASTGTLEWVQVLISPSGGITPTNACLIWYNYSDDTAYLSADNALPETYAWVGGDVLGAAGVTLSNSQCALDYANSSVVKTGSKVTLNLSIVFNPNWTGTKEV
ncbi:MAG: discoidin domain-containing protein, partial [Fimbriimonadaceae bacterium]